MQEKIIPYGTTYTVTVERADMQMIAVIGDDPKEGYILLGHGINRIPQKGEKGKIVFERGGPKGGYWHYYPNRVPCMHDGCGKDAKFEVVFEFRVNESHPPAVSTPFLFMCEDHMDVKWEDIYSEEGWNGMCDAFLKNGKAAPVVKYSNIVVRDITK